MLPPERLGKPSLSSALDQLLVSPSLVPFAVAQQIQAAVSPWMKKGRAGAVLQSWTWGQDLQSP